MYNMHHDQTKSDAGRGAESGSTAQNEKAKARSKASGIFCESQHNFSDHRYDYFPLHICDRAEK